MHLFLILSRDFCYLFTRMGVRIVFFMYCIMCWHFAIILKVVNLLYDDNVIGTCQCSDLYLRNRNDYQYCIREFNFLYKN